MMQKRIVLFVLLAVFLGLPLLGVLITTLYRSQMSQNGAVSMMGTRVAPSMGISQSESAGQDIAVAQTTVGIAPMPDNFAMGEDRVIIKNALLQLVVSEIQPSVDKITTLTQENNGYVTSSSISRNNFFIQNNNQNVQSESLTASMTLRIPADKLDAVLGQIRQLALKVTQDSITATDQTKQKVDGEARLKNLQATETQLQSIMKQAKTVQETLQVQSQLSATRSEIEVLTAELQNLSNNAAMANVSITLTTKEADQPIVSPQQNSVFDELKSALKNMVRLYRNLFIAGMQLIILILPALIIALVAWLAWQRFARKS